MRVQRVEAEDVLTRDGETALLLDGHLVRLGALAAAIHALTQEPVEVATLAARLEDAFGVPTAGTTTLDATKDAVADLVHHGVLLVRD